MHMEKGYQDNLVVELDLEKEKDNEESLDPNKRAWANFKRKAKKPL